MSRRAPNSPLGSLASAIALYLLLGAFNVLAAAIVPWLVELWERSPRLAALAWLALLASPAAFVAMIHHAAHSVMDRFDASEAPKVAARGLVPGLPSVKAGLFAWFVISFASMASAWPAPCSSSRSSRRRRGKTRRRRCCRSSSTSA